MEDQNEVHQCIYCHQEAKFQFKNGKWCCSKNMNGCPEIKRQRSEKSKEVWKKVNEKGYDHLQDVPKEERRKKQKFSSIPGICFYCGNQANFQLGNGKWCCKKSANQCPAIIEKNRQSVLKAYENGLGQRKAQALTTEVRFKIGSATRGKTKFNCEWQKVRGEKLHKRYENGELKPSFQGKHHSDKNIDKIVDGMLHFRIGVSTKGIKHGWYKNYWCDSSWELAYIIYNLEHDIKFKRNEEGFQYTFNGKIRKYYPDFILEDGTYIEIKGRKTEIVNTKLEQFPKDKKIIILYQEDLKKHFDYVKTKYGIDYWKLLKENPE